MKALRKVVKTNLPKGFKEVMAYGMIGYVVPHSIYPAGYHCDPTLPLGFISIASQKNFVAIYHMGIYGDPKLLKWFNEAYSKVCKTKIDMGKSCIRFKKPNDIPLDLIGELCTKISVEDYLKFYEAALSKTKTYAK